MKEKKETEMAIAARIAQRKLHAREEMELMIEEVVSDEVLKISTSEVRYFMMLKIIVTYKVLSR